MKKAFGIFAVMIMALSCRMIEEEALYNEYDDDWELVQALAAKKCKEDSKIFTELAKRTQFSSYFDNDTYYKVDIKLANGAEYDDFIKIDNIDATSMQIHYFDSQTLGDSRTYTFTETQNTNLITAISNGVCDTRDDFKFSSSGLDSSSVMNFTDKRQDGDSDSYTKITDAFKAQTTFPLPFILWNKTRTTTIKTSGNDAEDPESDTYSITEISLDACVGDSKCNQAENTHNWTFAAGAISVDANAYNSNATSSEIIEAN